MPTVIICPNCGANIPAGAAAAELGRTGGTAKTDRKAAAVRENGRKGGRPKKKKGASDAENNRD